MDRRIGIVVCQFFEKKEKPIAYYELICYNICRSMREFGHRAILRPESREERTVLRLNTEKNQAVLTE